MVAGLGEMLAAAVIKEVVRKLSALLQASVQGPVKIIRSFKEDLEEMKMTLESMTAAIADAERRSVNDHAARLWLKRLRNTAYEISDMFDEFQPPRKLPAPQTWYKGFWLLESPRWSNNYIIPARSLFITWGGDDRYWRSHSIPDCRFAESMELLEVWWLWIMGTVPAGALCANTCYDVYLVYKLADEHDGLRWGDSFINLDDKDHSRALVSFIDEDAVRVDGVAYPVTRSEGWMELWLGEFDSKHGQSEVKVGVTETTDTYAKKGLIIEGIEIRVKSRPRS